VSNRVQHFAPILKVLEDAFRLLERRVPQPTPQPWNDSFVFRCAERSIHQAIVQKLARTISGLYAIQALLEKGLFQEQGVIQRTVDEFQEDVTFLSLGVIHGEITDLHQKYLDYFYAEEFSDPEDLIKSHQSRGMVGRDKIRAYINRDLGADSSRANVAGKVITKAYSGFVHAASPHIMDMYGGVPPRFDVKGEYKLQRMDEHADDAFNYFYRALHSTAFAVKAFGEDAMFEAIYAWIRDFDARTAKS
jgi:hypothetical protein